MAQILIRPCRPHLVVESGLTRNFPYQPSPNPSPIDASCRLKCIKALRDKRVFWFGYIVFEGNIKSLVSDPTAHGAAEAANRLTCAARSIRQPP